MLKYKTVILNRNDRLFHNIVAFIAFSIKLCYFFASIGFQKRVIKCIYLNSI